MHHCAVGSLLSLLLPASLASLLCLPTLPASVRCRSPFSSTSESPLCPHPAASPGLLSGCRCCSSALFAAPLFLLLFLCLVHTHGRTNTHTLAFASDWAAAMPPAAQLALLAPCASCASCCCCCFSQNFRFRFLAKRACFALHLCELLPLSLYVCVLVLVYCVYATQKCIANTKTKIFESSVGRGAVCVWG